MCFVFIREQTENGATYIKKLIGFYTRDEKCLLRGTNWVFNQSNLRFVFKWFIICFGQIE